MSTPIPTFKHNPKSGCLWITILLGTIATFGIVLSVANLAVKALG